MTTSVARATRVLLGVAAGMALLVSSAGLVGAEEPAPDVPIQAKALTDHECNADQWHFIINGVDTEAHAPASISVTWDDDSQQTVELDRFTPGGVAMYTTTEHLDATVTAATATIYGTWSGQFNLSDGPCAAPGTEGSNGSDDHTTPGDEDNGTGGNSGTGDDNGSENGDHGGDTGNDNGGNTGTVGTDTGATTTDVLGESTSAPELPGPDSTVGATSAPAAPVQETAVLDSTVTRTPAGVSALPRTGPDSVGALLPAGIGLILLGLAFEFGSRRRRAGVR